ncbi:hypothetical protein M408DRAFT_202689 [Serendipita vermifera MAFF 305830]|uniref:Mitochondrial import inner membrane translocase subunit TIM22 n=1 Tax=Serendipita vermifera MAFF 305830 TaxID=933852 RepID=A0A0C3B161_SERVB|nr:hypothetical protein M408DRAFT_202689 [Serendipita vermifera MAFF 305830]
MTTPTDETSPSLEEGNNNNAIRINVNVNQRLFILPAFGAFTGLSLGLLRGSRDAKLQFLAENVHKQPRTVRGWYFYNKTKNYRMMLGGLRTGGRDAVKIGALGFVWAGIEEAVLHTSSELEPGKEFIAGLGTATAFSVVTRLGAKAGRRAVILGGAIGGMMSLLRIAQNRLEESVKKAKKEGGGGRGAEEIGGAP